MRLPIVLMALIAAQPALAETPATSSPFIVQLDVPQDRGPQQVDVMVREFPVGGSSGWHVHAGVETAYLLSGEMSLDVQGQPTRRLHPGDSFSMPRGVPHNGANIGTVPARLVITFLVDKAAPLRTPVAPPSVAP